MKKIIALLLVAVFVLSLVACGNGETPPYFPSGNPSDPPDPIEQQYQEIKSFLTDVNDNVFDFNDDYWGLGSFHDYENSAFLQPKDALAFSYKWLNEHKDYKDCADYLQNFVLVEDTLTKIKKQTTDVFGQVSETVSETYYYDNEGNCFQFSDLYKTFEFIHVFDIAEEYIKECQYDDNGKLISADLYQRNNVGVLGTKITFVYDERGNLTEAAFVHYDGTSWSNTFTYNESNQLMTAKYKGDLNFSYFKPGYEGSYYHLFQYEYDEQGQLSKTMAETKFAYPVQLRFYNEYIYNEDGQIVEIHYSDHKEVYTYREDGQIAYIESVPSDTGIAQSYKLVYHYEDLLCYHK